MGGFQVDRKLCSNGPGHITKIAAMSTCNDILWPFIDNDLFLVI